MNDNYFRETSHHEWVLTNALGGYALGTGNLINQRKYHSILTSADKKLNRFKLISSLEEQVEWRGETFHLDSNNYSNCIYPEGFLHLVKSWLRPYPIFLYSSLTHSNKILIKKEIFMDKGSNTVLIKYTNLGFHLIHLNIRPKISLANHHHLNANNYWERTKFYSEYKETEFFTKNLSNDVSLFCFISKGKVKEDHTLYRECYYPWEAMRGYDASEDLLSPASLILDILPNESCQIIFSDKNVLNKNRSNFSKISSQIESFYHKLPYPADYPQYNTTSSPLLERLDYDDSALFDFDGYMKILEFSLEDFIIEDNIIAGYPWFGCWGRDTMIFLNSVLEKEDGEHICLKILNQYTKKLKNGLLPNMLFESGNQENYNSIDAIFYYLLVYYKLFTKYVEKNKVNQLKEILPDIIKVYQKVLSPLLKSYYSTTIRSSEINHIKHPFHIAQNGLLILEPEFAASTWMDAKVNNQPVTPRDGAPIEINALFYNSLCALEELLSKYSMIFNKNHPFKLPKYFYDLKKSLYESFDLFWIGDFFADRLKDNSPVLEYRPNAIIALSLPFDITSQTKQETVLRKAEDLFLTKYGLRTISQDDYLFRKKYLGNQTERDKQYHQGTVWAWLLEPYVKLFYKVHKHKKTDNNIIIEKIEKVIHNFRNGYLKGHIASAAEVWDGFNPHFPKGCPAQAWSVAAVYYTEKLLFKLKQEV